MMTLEERLSYLESRLEALEANNSEVLQPTYLTLTNGLVGAQFTGDVEANTIEDLATDGQIFKLTSTGQLTLKGDITANSLKDAATNGQIFLLDALGNLTMVGALSMKADTTPDAIDTVQWLAAAKAFASLSGYTPDSKAGFATLNAQAQDPAANSQVIIAATDDLNQNRAFLSIFQSAEGTGGSNVQAKAGLVAKTIIANSGNSDFLQLAGAADTPTPSKQRIAWKTLQFTATGSASVSLTLAHGLGYTPAISFGWGVGWAGFFSESSGPDATNLHLTTSTAPVSGSPFMRWIAIGG